MRDAARWDAPAVDAFLRCTTRHREHARDPQHRPEVIINDSCSRMAWHRWAGWKADDRRWCTHLIDNTDQPVAESVDQVERWVTEQLDALRSGRLPLSRSWTAPPVAHTDHDS
ncbi:hypothetical protein ACFVOK_25915 [Streptomyces sp. NPDC057798]|uniref:hypothetical protein n=1 Tax=Streptomyces sp. NPDC057798 TaxID=3346252 RepID=UPI0036D19881